MACVRHHHHLFLVFFHRHSLSCSSSPPSLSSSLLIGWVILSSNHPPSSSTSFHFLDSRRFIAFQIVLDTTSELVFVFLIFASCRSPPSCSPSPSSSRSVPPSLPLALSICQSLLLSISRSGLRVFQNRQRPHSHAQNTSVNPTFFSRFEVIVHQSAIPSHHPYPYVYPFTSTSCIHVSHITTPSNIVICIPRPLTH